MPDSVPGGLLSEVLNRVMDILRDVGFGSFVLVVPIYAACADVKGQMVDGGKVIEGLMNSVQFYCISHA